MTFPFKINLCKATQFSHKIKFLMDYKFLIKIMQIIHCFVY